MNSFIRFPRVTRMIFFYMRGVIHASASQLQPKRDSNISPPPTSEKMIHMFMMLNNVWAFQSWGAMVVSVYFALCVCAEFVQSFHRVKHTLIYSIQIHRITRTSESIDNMFMFAVVLICVMDLMRWVSCVLVLCVLSRSHQLRYTAPRLSKYSTITPMDCSDHLKYVDVCYGCFLCYGFHDVRELWFGSVCVTCELSVCTRSSFHAHQWFTSQAPYQNIHNMIIY